MPRRLITVTEGDPLRECSPYVRTRTRVEINPDDRHLRSPSDDAIDSNNRTRSRCGCPKGGALARFPVGKRYFFLPGNVAEFISVVIGAAAGGTLHKGCARRRLVFGQLHATHPTDGSDGLRRNSYARVRTHLMGGFDVVRQMRQSTLIKDWNLGIDQTCPNR
ncbi:hypothetical protein, partial [Ralstonia pseudosolanacearum]